jgi:hypothetical protein
MTGMYQRVFFDHRSDLSHSGPLGQRHEFYGNRDLIPRCISLVREGQTVHDFARPSVLNLQRLIVLESFIGESSKDDHVPRRVKVMLERRSMSRGLELVSDVGIVQVRADGRGQITGECKVEGEDVLTGFHGVVVRLFAGEERPFVGDDRVSVMVVLGRRSSESS